MSHKKNPLVHIKNLSKHYEGNAHASVQDISMNIEEGEFFALLGPSGCGKTTLMRMIAGLEKPDSGVIIVDGINMQNIPPYLRPINMMFQSYALFSHMDVEQNVAFGLKQEKLSDSVIRERVDEALAMVKMTRFANRKTTQLSGGQQQRVALARSIVKRPKLLLLDEPLASLDRQIREQTRIELMNIQSILGITFVMVTHDQEEAMSVANRMGVMENGKLVQIGTPQEIYEYPNSRFVADFIGSINIFKGLVSYNDNNVKIIYSSDTGTKIVVPALEPIAEGAEVWVAVRPEEMIVNDQVIGKQDNVIEGNVIDVAFMGYQVVYHIILRSNKVIKVSVPTAARSKHCEIKVDDKVTVSWHHSDGVVLLS